MQELIERLQKATGPDRELDGRIWAEIDGRDVRLGESHFGRLSLLAKSRRAPHDECVVGAYADGGRFLTVGQNPPLPDYTASTDAALTLVSAEAGVRLERYWLADREAWTAVLSTGGVPSDPARQFIAEGAYTAAVALCTAALKLRAER